MQFNDSDTAPLRCHLFLRQRGGRNLVNYLKPLRGVRIYHRLAVCGGFKYYKGWQDDISIVPFFYDGIGGTRF